jgi:hypothetical protein
MHQTLAAVLYAFLFILAFCTGPLVVPRFIHQDPVIAAHADTPDVATISGWYGPGAWIALILTSLSAAWGTMSMSWHIIRHHTISILALGPNDTCDRTYHDQWPGDADLIVLLVYASFATVDLTQHSLQIMRADVPHIEPPKMPAMQASATAVFVSCGLAHVMLVPLAFTGLCESKSTFSFIRSCWRRLLITTALLLTTYTGIFICYQSQEMIVARDKSALTLTSLGPDGTASLIFAFAFLVMYPSLTMSFARFWSINFSVAPLYFACLYGVSSLVFPDHFSAALRKPLSSVIWARTAVIAVIAWFIPLAIFLFFNLVVLQVCGIRASKPS